MAIDRRLEIRLDGDAYGYDDGPPRTNSFVSDFAETAYGAGSYPTTESGFPVTTTDLFENYSEYAWIQLGPVEKKAGAIAVWKGHAAVVLEDGVTLLYSSEIREGRLATATVDELRLGEPLYIIPRVLVDPEG